MTVSVTGRYVTTLVYESIKHLQDAVNKFEVLEQLEVKAAEFSTELDESDVSVRSGNNTNNFLSAQI